MHEFQLEHFMQNFRLVHFIMCNKKSFTGIIENNVTLTYQLYKSVDLNHKDENIRRTKL